MKNYTFKEWAEARTISEGVDSDPQPGDFVITNPKSFIDSVLTKSGKLKNDGISHLSNFSRFKVENVDGRKVKGSVSHRTYSGGFTKKFNSYDFLDVTPAFNMKNGTRVWINNAPGRRATAHYINKMYPIWAGKMGIEGYATPENDLANDQMMDSPQIDNQSEFEPELQYKKFDPQPQQSAQPIQQIVQPQYKQIQPQLPYKQIEPQSQQAAPWEKDRSSYTMKNREVVPASDYGDNPGANFGFDSPNSTNSYDQLPDSIPMNGPEFGNDPFDMDSDVSQNTPMQLAASYDPMISAWNDSGKAKKYNYYPE